MTTAKDGGFIIFTKFIEQTLENNRQMISMLVNGATANAVLNKDRFVSVFNAICQQLYIAYAVVNTFFPKNAFFTNFF